MMLLVHLHQLLLHLGMSGELRPALSLEVFSLQAVCAAIGRVWSTAACAASGLCMSGLQQSMQPLTGIV
jgi:hypothetical protein